MDNSVVDEATPAMVRPCPDCQGEGVVTIDAITCVYCNGTGRVETYGARQERLRLERAEVVTLREDNQRLLLAAKQVLAGLDERISAASDAGDPVPLFDGIGELHDAISGR